MSKGAGNGSEQTGNTMAATRGKTPGTKSQFKRSTKSKTDDPAKALADEAERHRAAGHYTSATVAYGKAIRRRPREPAYHFARGQIWHETDKPKNALKDF